MLENKNISKEEGNDLKDGRIQRNKEPINNESNLENDKNKFERKEFDFSKR